MSAILAIAHRDFVKLLRGRARIVSDFVFPLLLIGFLGPALQAGFGSPGGLNLQTFVFTGVLAQTVWQSAALGVISLIADRDEDFSQEIFVSPISRYSIVIGKIIGESLVALPQATAIIAFGFLLGVPMSAPMLVALIGVVGVVAIFGASFGIIVLSNLTNQRQANQIFPFIMLPQFFLAGVFNPVQNLPWFLDLLSRIAPMRYAVDLVRNVFYGFEPSTVRAVSAGVPENLAVMGCDVRGLHRGRDGPLRALGAQPVGPRRIHRWSLPDADADLRVPTDSRRRRPYGLTHARAAPNLGLGVVPRRGALRLRDSADALQQLLGSPHHRLDLEASQDRDGGCRVGTRGVAVAPRQRGIRLTPPQKDGCLLEWVAGGPRLFQQQIQSIERLRALASHGACNLEGHRRHPHRLIGLALAAEVVSTLQPLDCGPGALYCQFVFADNQAGHRHAHQLADRFGVFAATPRDRDGFLVTTLHGQHDAPEDVCVGQGLGITASVGQLLSAGGDPLGGFQITQFGIRQRKGEGVERRFVDQEPLQEVHGFREDREGLTTPPVMDELQPVESKRDGEDLRIAQPLADLQRAGNGLALSVWSIDPAAESDRSHFAGVHESQKPIVAQALRAPPRPRGSRRRHQLPRRSRWPTPG